MANLNITIPHSLPQEEAIKRIKKLLGEMKKQYVDKISNLHEEWKGNSAKFSFSAMGSMVSGTLTVDSSQVKLEGKLPIIAMFFKGEIEKIICQQATELLK